VPIETHGAKLPVRMVCREGRFYCVPIATHGANLHGHVVCRKKPHMMEENANFRKDFSNRITHNRFPNKNTMNNICIFRTQVNLN
jgi:hypothetical protein